MKISSLISNKRSFLFGIAGIVLALFMFMLVRPVQADDTRIITIYADDQEYAVNSSAATVKEVLDRAQVSVFDNDLVEPSLDTEITTDNFNVNVYRARPVTVIDGNERYTIMTPHQSPLQVAKGAGIEVYPEDNFRLERVNDFVSEGTLGLKLYIDRSTPLTIDLFGTPVAVRTQGATVADVLEENDLDASSADSVTPSVDTPVTEGMTVSLIKIGNSVVSEKVPLAFGEEIVHDTSKMVGERTVQTPGVPGERLVTYEITYKNGVEVGRVELESVVVTPAKNQVVVEGTKVADPRANVALGEQLAASRGWTGAEWSCLYQLWSRESGWNHLAGNSSSGAYGIPQSLPGSKMGSAGADWLTNPQTQIIWGMGYVAGRYGTPCGAWNHFLSNHWY